MTIDNVSVACQHNDLAIGLCLEKIGNALCHCFVPQDLCQEEAIEVTAGAATLMNFVVEDLDHFAVGGVVGADLVGGGNPLAIAGGEGLQSFSGDFAGDFGGDVEGDEGDLVSFGES